MAASQKSSDILHPLPSPISSNQYHCGRMGIYLLREFPYKPLFHSSFWHQMLAKRDGGTCNTSRFLNIRVVKTSIISNPHKHAGTTSCSTCKLMSTVSYENQCVLLSTDNKTTDAYIRRRRKMVSLSLFKRDSGPLFSFVNL